ncbi:MULTISPECIES: MoaD/ThiS family protein [Streptomyces]|uniref:Thiamine S protein n=1 Tax=Streptomyces albus (strain ATCC 21838 / DSM 41398 / FERM P-419 / JCM 4703 / NBRC 107858) TaxID=1081613 RepID=A0A0B5F1L8_STRA4|nr:MoaD/ThiS family protein [Streptomyces sp. SCSIO ZS0520]AJE84771.1 thiamine S protein [Streptomyces albus]AOU79077.1 thiamine S protein [Streptomyces albus]AYN34811.1 MoaD/ThiS family protein [Streptomyces albus]
MIVKVRGVLLRFTNYENDIEVGGETVRAGLNELTERYPNLSEVLLDREGAVRATHLIALNGEQLSPAELDREATEDDRVDIITAVSGG